MAAATKPKPKYTWAGSKAKHTVSEAAHKAAVKKKIAGRPVVPGGTLTKGALDAQVKAAVADRFGLQQQAEQQQLGEATQAKKDIVGPGGFYDQYLAAVAQHAKNVGDISAASNAAVGAVAPAMTGLAGQDIASLQARANADATARGMAPAGDVTNVASQALSARQALAGSFMARQAAQNASTQTLADAQANVIAPAQKLTGANVAEGRIREAQTAQRGTAAQAGSYAAGQRQQAIGDETKNVLAQQIATGKSAADLAKANLAAETSIKNTQTRANTTLTAAQMRLEASQRKADADAAKDANKINQYGVKNGQWANWSTSHRERWIKDYKNKTGSGGSGGSGKGPTRSPQDISEANTQAGLMKQWAEAAKAGDPFDPKHKGKDWKKNPLDRAGAAKKIIAYAGGKLKDPVLVSAVLDAVYSPTHQISTVVEKRLREAGYSPKQIAAALGVGLYSQSQTGKNTTARGNQGNLGQTGHA